MWTALIYVNYFTLFSRLKLKLGHNFSQFIHGLKTGIFLVLVLRLYFQVFPNSQRHFGAYEGCSI